MGADSARLQWTSSCRKLDPSSWPASSSASTLSQVAWNSFEPTPSPSSARAKPWNRAGLRSANFFICPKNHENALACRPSAGQRTRTSRQLQWLYRRFRTPRRIGRANPLRPGMRRRGSGRLSDAPNIPKGLAKQSTADCSHVRGSLSTSWSFSQSAAFEIDLLKGIRPDGRRAR